MDQLGATAVPAIEALRSYGDRLSLFRASGARTGIAELREIADADGGTPPLLVVDYLQKVSATQVAGGKDECPPSTS